METKDLMIGDFLRYKQDFPNTHLQGRIVKVYSIRGRLLLDVVTIDDDNIHESQHLDWLEPIPITPEILKKNGFEPNEFTLYYLPIKDGSIRFLEHQYGSYCNIIRPYQKYDGVCNYVHELHHALRLCKIDKEIEL